MQIATADSYLVDDANAYAYTYYTHISLASLAYIRSHGCFKMYLHAQVYKYSYAS